MTTDAPPERMMLEPCPFCGADAQVLGEDETHGGFYVACLGPDCRCAMGEGYDRDAMPDHHYLDKEAAIEAWNRREAARRLSAPAGDAGQWEYWDNGHEEGVKGIPAEFKSHPEDELEADLSSLVKAHNAGLSAPAAPRVGDDGLPREPTRNMCHAGATDPMVHEYVRLVEAAGGEILGKFSSPVRAPIHGVMLCYRVWQLMYDAALSAPPAASADEREIAEAFDAAPIGHGTSQWIGFRAGFAAGYRKRAAQGVGEAVITRLDRENADRAPEPASAELHRLYVLISDVRRIASGKAEAPPERLSALPKGQEHE